MLGSFLLLLLFSFFWSSQTLFILLDFKGLEILYGWQIQYDSHSIVFESQSTSNCCKKIACRCDGRLTRNLFLLTSEERSLFDIKCTCVYGKWSSSCHIAELLRKVLAIMDLFIIWQCLIFHSNYAFYTCTKPHLNLSVCHYRTESYK